MLGFERVSKRYGGRTAVDDVTLVVRRGSLCGLLGRNGAGKTTLVRMLAGLARPSTGRTAIDGVPYRALTCPARKVGVALEHPGFQPRRTGRGHLRALARAGGLPRSRVDEVLTLTELSSVGDEPAGSYSLGDRQRLGLAQSLLGDPEALVLDEPANGMDPAGTRWLRDLIQSWASEGRAVLVSSHVLHEVAQVATDVAIVDRGRLLTHSPLAELERGARAARVRVAPGHEATLRAELERRGTPVEGRGEGRLVVKGVDPAEVGLLAGELGVAIAELGEESAALEDLFLRLTGGDDEAATQAE